jgi:small subunit ribosomal protein S18
VSESESAPAPEETREAAPAGPRPERPAGDRPSGDRPGGGPRRGGGGRGRFGRRRVCSFCVDKVEAIDYKDTGRFRRYVSDRGKIEPRRKTGTCARHQRMLTTALKRARHVALLPYTAEHIRASGVFASRY